MKLSGGIFKSAVAKSIPADGSNCPLVDDKTTVQKWLQALCNAFGIGASPGFAWGRSGNHSNGTWLRNNHVDSNKVGLPFGLTNGSIKKITVAFKNGTAQFDVRMYHHTGNLANLTLLTTVTTTGVGTIEDFVVNVPVPKNKMLAVQINNVKQAGSPKPKETQVFLIVKGDLT